MEASLKVDGPLVSILFPVYNAAPYLQDAVQSLLDQTYSNIEIIAIDDGSTDRSLEILRTFRDPRLRVFENGANLGLVQTLNRGFQECRGQMIARMDSDDISLPKRIEAQVEFLRAHPEFIMVSSDINKFKGQGHRQWRPPRIPQSESARKFYLSLRCWVYHPSVMMRREVIEQGYNYRSEFFGAEDYELWMRLSQKYRIGYLDEPLLSYRVHAASITISKAELMLDRTVDALVTHFPYLEKFSRDEVKKILRPSRIEGNSAEVSLLQRYYEFADRLMVEMQLDSTDESRTYVLARLIRIQGMLWWRGRIFISPVFGRFSTVHWWRLFTTAFVNLRRRLIFRF
jgi:glycosyltransferase involved in cell wall biosynthesis